MNTNNESCRKSGGDAGVSEDRESERAEGGNMPSRVHLRRRWTSAVVYLKSMHRMVEQAIVGCTPGRADRGKIRPRSDGSIAGALHDALSQVGAEGEWAFCGRQDRAGALRDHISVAVFLSIGLLYLDDVALGPAHRLI